MINKLSSPQLLWNRSLYFLCNRYNRNRYRGTIPSSQYTYSHRFHLRNRFLPFPVWISGNFESFLYRILFRKEIIAWCFVKNKFTVRRSIFSILINKMFVEHFWLELGTFVYPSLRKIRNQSGEKISVLEICDFTANQTRCLMFTQSDFNCSEQIEYCILLITACYLIFLVIPTYLINKRIQFHQLMRLLSLFPINLPVSSIIGGVSDCKSSPIVKL